MDQIFPSSPSESESKSESNSESALTSESALVHAMKTAAMLSGKAKQHSSQIPSKRSLQLHFEGEIANTIFTNQRLEDQGVLLRVVLRDDSGSIVEETAEIRIVVLDGSFPVDDIDVFTFQKYVIRERNAGRPLIAGESVITLKKGVSDIVNIVFTDNSSWIRSATFRLGAQVTKSVPTGLTVREAVSEAFVVKDIRMSIKKTAIISVDDEVYRLRCIAKNGILHNRMKMMNIFSVKDLLQLYVADADSLKKHSESSSNFEVSSNMLVDVATPNPDFFSTFKFLTALDLSGSCLTEVPSSIQDVTELRFLDLSWTRISRLPQSLVYLQKLQTLRLKGCMDLFELPERMNKFINIRHLDFDVLGQLMLMPTGIGHLTELRTLSAFIVDGEVINGKKCCNIKELKHMNNLSGKFCISGLEHVSSHDVEEAALTDKKHLKHLELRWSDAIAFLDKEDHVRVLEGLKPNSSLEELNIVCFLGEILSNWIEDSQYQNLVSVSLYKCEDCLNFPFLGRLPKLKNLEIAEMNAVEKIDHQFYGDGLDCVAFPLLENLSIDGMYRVESITNWDFACLVKFSINRCPILATLSLFLRCQSLKVLEITECPLLKYLPEEMLASPLESLAIDNCPLLRETYSKGGEDSNKIEHVISVWIESDGSQLSNGHSTDDDSSTEGIHLDDKLEEGTEI